MADIYLDFLSNLLFNELFKFLHMIFSANHICRHSICLRHIIEGDRKYRDENESFGEHGFTEKEFVGEELEDVEPDEEPDDSDLENLSFDDDDYLGEE